MDPERLKQIPLFEGLSKKDRARVATWADEVDLESGTRLVEQGEFGHEFFVLEEGSADVIVDGNRVDALGPGDFFGEIALLQTERRVATVLTTSPCRAIVMHSWALRSMEQTMPEVSERIRREMRRRMASS
jgi:cAMP-dependent protein kinase regulator